MFIWRSKTAGLIFDMFATNFQRRFRREIVERNGLTKLFEEIRIKKTIPDLSIQYRKFAEWLRIEVAATIYHLFLAEDNSPELFSQLKRIHSLIPYSVIKNVIRITNPAAVMSGILDIFLAQPFNTRSLMQRIFSLTLHDGIRSVQKSIDALATRINDKVFVDKIIKFVESPEPVKQEVRQEAELLGVDHVVAIIQSEAIGPEITPAQMERIFNAYVAFNSAVENVDQELKQGAQLFSYLKQLLKLSTRQRDKLMMLHLIEEPVTLQLFRDLFTIFYEPLVRVYKSANVYNSVTDFAVFIDDVIQVRRPVLPVSRPQKTANRETNLDHQLRLWSGSTNGTRLLIPTRRSRHSLTCVRGTSTTFINSSTKYTRTTMACSRS